MNDTNQTVPVVSGNNQIQNLTSGLSLSGAQGSSIALASAAAAEAIAKIQVAKAFPRNIAKAQNEILTICERKSLADIASYAYAKGGTTVNGASIHLLRSIAQSWGNIESGYIPDHSQQATAIKSYWIAYACDLERNVSKKIPFEVINIRHTKKGDYPITDPREQYENVANQAARRERACLECVIPRDIIEDALVACTRTLERKEGDITKEKLDSLVDSFADFGVTLEDLETFIQRKMSSIVPSQLVKLRTIYKSLRDGIAKKEDFFKGGEPKSPSAEGGDKQSQSADGGGTGTPSASAASGKRRGKTVEEFLEQHPPVVEAAGEGLELDPDDVK